MMKKLLALLLCLLLACAPALAESVKDETVYVLSDPTGKAGREIVSVWLSNPEALAALPDESSLTAIENLKGSEAFRDGVWQAGGKDIYYRGEGSEALPVEMTARYFLDGEEIAPGALLGKSGRVTIRYAFSAVCRYDMAVSGETRAVALPFAAVCGALLDGDVFANVEAENAKIINDGDRILVVGLALPGVAEDVALDGLELPDHIEISADVNGFTLPYAAAMATSEIFARLDPERLNDAEGLKDAVSQLTNGMAQLLDGGSRLQEGLASLNGGVSALSEGVSALSGGLDTLTANNDTLTGGSVQVFESLLSLANAQLAAAGAGTPALTMENYDAVLTGLLESLSESAVTAAARGQVEQAVLLQRETVRAAVAQAVEPAVREQVEAAVRENVLGQVLAQLDMTAEAYRAARESDALDASRVQQIEETADRQMQSEAVQALIAQQLAAQMQSEAVQTLIDGKTEEQLAVLIDENLRSEPVQAQISAALAQAEALKALHAQLASYAAFHNGLLTYTQGAAEAAAGAARLKESIPALQSGASQLWDGAQALLTGLTAFDDEGIEPLAGLVENDLSALTARVRAMIEAAQAYETYSGLPDGASGRVRFIWRLDSDM